MRRDTRGGPGGITGEENVRLSRRVFLNLGVAGLFAGLSRSSTQPRVAGVPTCGAGTRTVETITTSIPRTKMATAH